MHPILFKIPGINLPVNSYGFMIMVGFLLATYIGVQRGRKLNINSDIILDIGIISMIFGIIGAKINYLLQYSAEMPKNAYQIFEIGDGGMNWLGALLLGPVPYLFWWWRTEKDQKVKLWSWKNGILFALTLICAFVGARALHLFLERDRYDWGILSSWQSGFVLYGGLIAGVAAGTIYAKMRGESIMKVSDLAAAPIMLGIAFGRVGCFLNGCCYGKICTTFTGVSFPGPDSAPFREQLRNRDIDANALVSKPVHPTQLYETVATIAIFFILTWYWKKKKKNDGETVMLAGMLYPVWRFVVEFLRDDPRPNWLGPLSYSQTLSLFLFIACAVGFFLLRLKQPPLEGTPGDKIVEPAPKTA